MKIYVKHTNWEYRNNRIENKNFYKVTNKKCCEFDSDDQSTADKFNECIDTVTSKIKQELEDKIDQRELETQNPTTILTSLEKIDSICNQKNNEFEEKMACYQSLWKNKNQKTENKIFFQVTNKKCREFDSEDQSDADDFIECIDAAIKDSKLTSLKKIKPIWLAYVRKSLFALRSLNDINHRELREKCSLSSNRLTSSDLIICKAYNSCSADQEVDLQLDICLNRVIMNIEEEIVTYWENIFFDLFPNNKSLSIYYYSTQIAKTKNELEIIQSIINVCQDDATCYKTIWKNYYISEKNKQFYDSTYAYCSEEKYPESCISFQLRFLEKQNEILIKSINISDESFLIEEQKKMKRAQEEYKIISAKIVKNYKYNSYDENYNKRDYTEYFDSHFSNQYWVKSLDSFSDCGIIIEPVYKSPKICHAYLLEDYLNKKIEKNKEYIRRIEEMNNTKSFFDYIF